LASKQGEITERIATLRAFADGLQGRIEAVKEANGLRQLEREVDTKIVAFKGHTESEAKLSAALAQCSLLGEFFHAISQLREKSPQSPGDLQAILANCQAVHDRFKPNLSPAQSTLIDQVESDKRTEAETKALAARQWLQHLEKSWAEDESNPAEVQRRLSGVPAFLPDEAQAALAALQGKICQKIESNDEEWIVSKFREISDKGRRQKLLERLQQLVAED
jgi:hypothetical protein